MTAPADICNLALARIGQGKISSLAEQSAAAVACNDLYDSARRAVLAMHSWRFATKIDTLAPIDEVVPGYSFSYAIPSDSIHVIGLEPISRVPSIEFRVVGDALWTDDATGQIVYVWDQEDCNTFDPIFISALAYYLAADLAPVLTGKIDIQSGMLNAFGVTLRTAKGANAAQSRQPNRTGQEIRNSRQ